MTIKNLSQLVAAGVLTATVSAGVAAPAHAAESVPAPSCDTEALTAAVSQATLEVRAAQNAYTTSVRSNVDAAAKALVRREAREALVAQKKANVAQKAATKVHGKEGQAARAEARTAAATARAEAREARTVARAGRAQLRALVRADRIALKKQWDLAKGALKSARSALEMCAAATPEPIPAPEPISTPEPAA